MTQRDIVAVVMQQSAYDCNCSKEDFSKRQNIVTHFSLCDHSKAYYKLPIGINFVSFGSNIVASATDEFYGIAKEYIDKFTFYHCFETPNIYWLNDKLKPYDYSVCFMAEYWLPDVKRLKALDCPYELRILEKNDFSLLYLPEWSNALCADRKDHDMLGIGAYDEGKLVGFAACSSDAENMWQIGIDVLPDHRGQGIASCLTSRLALEILDRGKIPFYCCAWSNIASARNAIRSGFSPAWAEMTVKPDNVTYGFNL